MLHTGWFHTETDHVPTLYFQCGTQPQLRNGRLGCGICANPETGKMAMFGNLYNRYRLRNKGFDHHESHFSLYTGFQTAITLYLYTVVSNMDKATIIRCQNFLNSTQHCGFSYSFYYPRSILL